VRGAHPFRTATLLVALAASLAAADSAARGQRRDASEAYRARFLGKPAPAFTLKGLDGNSVSLADYRGKPVLINFWFSTCFPCRAETPDLIKLYEDHKDRGLVVLGVNLDDVLMPQEGRKYLDGFLKAFRLPYPLLFADTKMFREYGGVPVQPTSFLVDREGVVVEVFWGARPRATYESTVAPYLGGPSPEPTPDRPAPDRSAPRP
jgi:peroxiredoxin